MAPTLRNTSVDEIERLLDELRESEEASQRTSVLTHMAWVPRRWQARAERVLEGLGPRIPSRTILLHPDPAAKTSRLDAEIRRESFPEGGHNVCAETARIWLRGATARAPASVVVPLQIPDLPVFLRWRGQPPFGEREYEQLVGVSDRLIVDSDEWDDPARAYRGLGESFDRIVVSDVAWARTLRWRVALAGLWPRIGKARTLRVVGPQAGALLLCGWLRSRLRRDLALRHDSARSLRSVEVDGSPVRAQEGGRPTEADLLSDELERYSRDPVYEEAVRAV